MQNLFTKNAAIVALAIISLTTTAFIAVDRFKKISGKEAVKSREPINRARTGVVESAPILKNDGRLQACYENYLKKAPVVDEGAVRLHFSINRTGEIEGLKLASSDLNDEEFTTCLLNEVRARRIPVTPERLGVLISHKLNFKRRTPASIEY